MSIEDTQRAHEKELMDKPNVVGVGIGKRNDQDVIKVFVTHKVLESELQGKEIVPKDIDGYRIDVEEIGVVTAQGTGGEPPAPDEGG